MIIGAHVTVSNLAVLVRGGFLPLQYRLVLESLLWFLRIRSGESDPLLTAQYQEMRSDNDFHFSMFYFHAERYLTRLSSLSGLDFLGCSPRMRRKLIRRAMFLELNHVWNNYAGAAITHNILQIGRILICHISLFPNMSTRCSIISPWVAVLLILLYLNQILTLIPDYAAMDVNAMRIFFIFSWGAILLRPSEAFY